MAFLIMVILLQKLKISHYLNELFMSNEMKKIKLGQTFGEKVEKKKKKIPYNVQNCKEKNILTVEY